MLRLLPILLLASACARPDHIEIDPRSPRLLHKGDSVRLHAKMMDRGGKVFSRERAAFESRDPFVAAVDESGNVTALSSGHTVITARWSELQAAVPVEIDLVEALRMEPLHLELATTDEAVKVAVTALGYDGHALRDRDVLISSANPSVVRVDGAGKLWPVAAGQAVVRAKIDDKEAEVTVRVRGR